MSKTLQKAGIKALAAKRLSLITPCAVACMLVLLPAYAGRCGGGLLRWVGAVFFIGPFAGPEPGGAWRVLAFATWLAVAWLIAKSGKPSHRFRAASLLLAPPLSICVFNAVFDVGGAPPGIAPTAVVALIGALFYEISLACKWSRLTLAGVTFAACAVYGAATSLGLWGAFVAALAMAAVQVAWSGVEINVSRLTSASRRREFQYR